MCCSTCVRSLSGAGCCVPSRFGTDLQISDKLFVMDVGASNSKDMKTLRSHLQELRTSIISVEHAHTQTRAHAHAHTHTPVMGNSGDAAERN